MPRTVSRDCAETQMRQALSRFPFVERIVAEGGYAGAPDRSSIQAVG